MDSSYSGFQPYPVLKYLAADQPFTSNTTLADLTGLALSVLSGERWRIIVQLVAIGAATAGGIKTDVTSPSKTIIGSSLLGLVAGGGTNLTFFDQTPFAITRANDNMTAGYMIRWETVVTFSASGTFQVQAAQGTSNIVATTFKAGGTCIEAYRVI